MPKTFSLHSRLYLYPETCNFFCPTYPFLKQPQVDPKDIPSDRNLGPAGRHLLAVDRLSTLLTIGRHGVRIAFCMHAWVSFFLR